MNTHTIGILGGGQLGRMLNEAAARLNLKTIILDDQNSPAKQISNQDHINGSFKNKQDIISLAEKCTVLTVEIEHVDTDTLKEIEAEKPVEPNPETIQIIQDKFLQKTFLSQNGSIPITPFMQVSSEEDVRKAGELYGYPLMLKSKTLAYDGRGNKVVHSPEEIKDSIAALGGDKPNGPSLYCEQWVRFKKELAVMVAKSINGEVVSYPCVETIQKDNICHVVIAPAQIDGLLAIKAQKVARQVVKSFSGAGIFGVELFLLEDDSLAFNEVAPRPHNSGHYTIEACHTSQFEQHLRCITGMKLGSGAMKVPAAVMINIIGTDDGDKGMQETLKPCKDSLAIPGATVHLYGKSTCKKGRKMGHITIVGDSMVDLLKSVELLTLQKLPDARPIVSIIMGSDSDLPIVKPAATTLSDFDIPFELTIVSAHRTPDRMFEYAKTAHKRGIKVIIAAAGGAAHLPGMVAAITPLPVIGIPVALKVLDGVDSLHSIVQMPRGVPVATVAINNAVNAALLAVRILGTVDNQKLEKLVYFAAQQEQAVMEKVSTIQTKGWQNY